MPQSFTKQVKAGSADLAFEHEALEVLSRLTKSIRELIREIPGPTRRPTDLERTLGVRTKLAWQVHRLARTENPLDEVGNVPGTAAIERFLQAAVKRGVSDRCAALVREAHQEFQAFIDLHASSRSAFDSMISGMAANGRDHVDQHYKRLAFQSASHFWGIQAKTQLSCYIHWPSSDDPRMFDVISLRGLIGLRRFRRDVSWVVSRVRIADEDGVVRRQRNRRAIDRDPSDPYETGLLRRFCSQPLPKLRATPGEAGFLNVSMEGTSVGNQSSMTCIFADLWPASWPRYKDEHNQHHVHGSIIRTPSEVLIRDVVFHEDANIDPASRSVRIYGDHRAGTVELAGREQDCLPLREEIEYIGKGLDVIETPDVPDYPLMFQHVLESVGWDASRLQVFRLRMEYPVMPSTVVTQFDAPEAPQ